MKLNLICKDGNEFFYRSFQIVAIIRFSLIRLFLKKSRSLNFIYTKTAFSGLKNISLGKKNVFYKYVTVKAGFPFKNQTINIGNTNVFSEGSIIFAQGGSINIGNNNFIGERVQIQGCGGVEIGNHCMIAANTFISSSNHNIDNPFNEDYLNKEIGKKVSIDDHVWIGANCVILAGVNIEKCAIVAAGSVVTHNVKAYTMVAGVPAKIIKEFDHKKKEWIRIEVKH